MPIKLLTEKKGWACVICDGGCGRKVELSAKKIESATFYVCNRGRCRKRNLKYVKAEERRGNKTQEGENMGEQILVLAQATEENSNPYPATEVSCEASTTD